MKKLEYEKLKKILCYSQINKPEKDFNSIRRGNKAKHSELKVYLTINNLKEDKPIIRENKIFTRLLSSISRVHKLFLINFSGILNNQKKISTISCREMKRGLSKTSKTNPTLKTKRINREVCKFLSRASKDEKEKTKREDAETEIRKKNEQAEKDEIRQKRKFAYLMSQTEAFANFILKKKLNQDDLGEEGAQEGLNAAKKHFSNVNEFEELRKRHKGPISHVSDANKQEYTYKDVVQPKMLKTTLKDHQLKGLNWLINLYNQGINGILADDMGLGKTVQAISFLGYLAETENIWGPFLVITPASTLHNWENEFLRFIPNFKVINYYGNVQERAELRKKFKKSNIVVTSYQVAVMDESYLKRISWEYMILDEAQAIKSMTSQRWNALLAFKSRSRCLLTGTPIQNNMQELWSLLHFIMPTLFDSLSEFSDWFLTENKIDENQVSKLHTILKPFMLRRHKNDIKDEIGSKEIIVVYCDMSPIQRVLYDDVIKTRLPILGCEGESKTEDKQPDFENKIMHLKKICNHPCLFEKQEPSLCFNLSVEGDSDFIGSRMAFKKYVSKDNPMLNISCKLQKSDLLNSMILSSKTNYLSKWNKNTFCNKFNFENIRENSQTFYDIENKRKKYLLNLKNIIFYHQKVFNKFYESNLPNDIKIRPNDENFISIPPVHDFVSNSGKLKELDILLKNLRLQNHRVLIYFQMTKMMDLFEDYLIKMEYSYLRLDGSSRISVRADLVKEWQNSDIFIFILSTRAGGVGINLTAADTVIFYDSDWNPTVDQQAMDRVHRLGQKKDVTVYRLVTRNSIEEAIMLRASEKDEMQRIVIKGDVFRGFN